MPDERADASSWVDLFNTKSPAYHSALAELRSVMLRVGFLVDKKAETQATLRVYVRERIAQPLLNPRFISREARSGREHAFLEITVLSKLTELSNIHESLGRRLANFSSSSLVTFEPVREMQRHHFLHGCFLLPLELRAGAGSLAPYLASLEPGLRELLSYLD